MGRIKTYDGAVSAEEIKERLTEAQETKSYYEIAIPELENLTDRAKQEPTKQIMSDTLRRSKIDYNLCKKAVSDLTGLLNKVQNGEKVTCGQVLRTGAVIPKSLWGSL